MKYNEKNNTMSAVGTKAAGYETVSSFIDPKDPHYVNIRTGKPAALKMSHG